MEIDKIESLLNGKGPKIVISDTRTQAGSNYQIRRGPDLGASYSIELFDLDQGIVVLNDTQDTRYGQTIIEFQNIEVFNLHKTSTDSATYPFANMAALNTWASNTANWKDLQEGPTILKIDTDNPLTG